MSGPDPFVCPLCARPSWHPRDKQERFCARCGFVDDRIAQSRVQSTTVRAIFAQLYPAVRLPLHAGDPSA